MLQNNENQQFITLIVEKKKKKTYNLCKNKYNTKLNGETPADTPCKIFKLYLNDIKNHIYIMGPNCKLCKMCPSSLDFQFNYIYTSRYYTYYVYFTIDYFIFIFLAFVILRPLRLRCQTNLPPTIPIFGRFSPNSSLIH